MRYFFVICMLVAGSAFASAPALETTFTAQAPVDPGLYDAPAVPYAYCDGDATVRVLRYQEPMAGVTSHTGLLMVIPGYSYLNDCVRPTQAGDTSWPDTKDVLMCSVFYRNESFSFPYDYGKLQITDVLRGLGKALEMYPQIDRRRLYLYGASGGGQISLQLLSCSRDLWAEAHIFCAFTLVTTLEEAQTRYHADHQGEGFNVTLTFPEQQGSLSMEEWERYQAERNLRGPQNSFKRDLPVRNRRSYPYIFWMHGTADDTVDPNHMYDMISIVSHKLHTKPTHAMVFGGEKWTVRNWNFWTIANGNHGLGTADPLINDFKKATNYRIPDAFTRVRPRIPDLTIDYKYPAENGWTFHIEGSLTSATITTEAAKKKH